MNTRQLALACLLATLAQAGMAAAPLPWRGISLSSAEWGEKLPFPGVYGKDFVYPTVASTAYYQAKGLNLMRIGFRWERMQPVLNGELDPTELGRRRIRGASVPQTSSAATQGDNEVSRVTPGELRSQRINRQAMTPPVAEGSRGKLSDPPKDYLQGNGTTATVQPAEQKSFWQKITGK